jgi:hypothetical protein
MTTGSQKKNTTKKETSFHYKKKGFKNVKNYKLYK